MKKDLGNYVPFLHDNLEFKKNVIDLARNQPQTFEGVHTATLIYINAVDYIAVHLLENMMCMNYIITHNALNGVYFFNVTKPKPEALGKTLRELIKYEFPDKADFIAGLKEFAEIRNRIAHNLLSLTEQQRAKIDSDFAQIKILSESLLNKYDSIARGLTDAWISYKSRLISTGTGPINESAEVK